MHERGSSRGCASAEALCLVAPSRAPLDPRPPPPAPLSSAPRRTPDGNAPGVVGAPRAPEPRRPRESPLGLSPCSRCCRRCCYCNDATRRPRAPRACSLAVAGCGSRPRRGPLPCACLPCLRFLPPLRPPPPPPPPLRRRYSHCVFFLFFILFFQTPLSRALPTSFPLLEYFYPSPDLSLARSYTLHCPLCMEYTTPCFRAAPSPPRVPSDPELGLSVGPSVRPITILVTLGLCINRPCLTGCQRGAPRSFLLYWIFLNRVSPDAKPFCDSPRCSPVPAACVTSGRFPREHGPGPIPLRVPTADTPSSTAEAGRPPSPPRLTLVPRSIVPLFTRSPAHTG